MFKKEMSELKKFFKPNAQAISKIATCCVDTDKNVTSMQIRAFQMLPEEEMFKYLAILQKCLSGTENKNLYVTGMNDECPNQKKAFLQLRDQGLNDDQIYDVMNAIIAAYNYPSHYVIIIADATYDIPVKTKDENRLDDSEEVYHFLIGTICPLELSVPGLYYNQDKASLENRIQDRIVQMPLHGFLYPAFTNRTTDIHNLVYYTKKAEDRQENLLTCLTGNDAPSTPATQKEIFADLCEEFFDKHTSCETMVEINEQIAQMMDDQGDGMAVGKRELAKIFRIAAPDNTNNEQFDQLYDKIVGKETLLLNNIADTSKVEIQTDTALVRTKQCHAAMLETKMIDGRRCLIVPYDGVVTVNGVAVTPMGA